MDGEIINFKNSYLIPVVGLFQSGYDIVFQNQRTRQTPLEADLYSLYQAITTGVVLYGLEKLLN